ncbi:hypothetical protein DFH11DRAFT_1308365 [Phellopilus nigrolimitatus]|nr:hypothetical protein DFH11DRAFT_1308365 [Phellopilus nigrolimitatus]
MTVSLPLCASLALRAPQKWTTLGPNPAMNPLHECLSLSKFNSEGAASFRTSLCLRRARGQWRLCSIRFPHMLFQCFPSPCSELYHLTFREAGTPKSSVLAFNSEHLRLVRNEGRQSVKLDSESLGSHSQRYKMKRNNLVKISQTTFEISTSPTFPASI